MTAAERAEFERREAIRAARFEAFALRTIAANREAEQKAQAVCNRRLRERQLVLDYAI